MKKITIAFLILTSLGFSQTKSTGIVNLSSNVFATLSLNNDTSTAILTLTGPNDRWFALQFGSFTADDGMVVGEDVVYWNNVTLVDAVQNGIGAAPIVESVNNWTLISNNDNTPSSGLRTIVFSRPFTTGDSNDFQFNFADTSIDFAWARRSSVGYVMNNHGGANRGYAINVPLNVLGVEDFSLNASLIYPNPSNGEFTIETKTFLKQVNIYTQTGALVKKVTTTLDNENKVILSGLQSGIYLLELCNDTEKTWKKLIVN